MRIVCLLVALAACTAPTPSALDHSAAPSTNKAVAFAKWLQPDLEVDCFEAETVKGVDQAVCRFTGTKEGEDVNAIVVCKAGRGVAPECSLPEKAEAGPQPQSSPPAPPMGPPAP